MDFKLDESYTPKTCAVRVGNNLQDMKARGVERLRQLSPPRARVSEQAGCTAQEVRSLDLAEPTGWIYVRLKRPGDGDDGGGMRAYLVQLLVQTNHQNGRDTHVRQIKVFGPRKCVCPRRNEKGAPKFQPTP